MGIYNTDTSREIDRLSRDKLCKKFDLFKIKDTHLGCYGIISYSGSNSVNEATDDVAFIVFISGRWCAGIRCMGHKAMLSNSFTL